MENFILCAVVVCNKEVAIHRIATGQRNKLDTALGTFLKTLTS